MASPSVARTRRPPASLESEDALAMRAAELGEWAKRNTRRILTTAAVLAAAMGAALLYWFWQQGNEAKAATEFLQLSSTPPGPQRTSALERFVAQHGGTTEGKEARLELASTYLDANQTPRALPHAREVAKSGGTLKYQGQLMLGAVLARNGDRAGAIQAYRDAAASTEYDFQRAEALNQAALLEEGAGNWTGAAAIFREMLKETEEGSMDRSIIEMRLAEAEGRLAGTRR